MRQTENQRARRQKLLLLLWLLLILFSLLTVASYTWFSISTTPRVSDLYMFISTKTGLEIAKEIDGEWGPQLDFREMEDTTAPLRPVTWSEKNQRFYAAIYGLDGRLTGNWEPLSDERNANKNTSDGYYVKTTLYARTGQDVTVSLSSAVEVDEGINGAGTYLIGTPVWNAEEVLHNNGGQGAETAMRIGIRVTYVDETGEPTGEPELFYIYEPNSDLHIDGSEGYTATPSIDATANLIGEDRLIRQTASTWTEAYPVQRDVQIYSLGDFTTDTELFSLKASQMVKIDLYVWLEGQDIDCTNQINDAQILANIQFIAQVEGQSGLVPIDE